MGTNDPITTTEQYWTMNKWYLAVMLPIVPITTQQHLTKQKQSCQIAKMNEKHHCASHKFQRNKKRNAVTQNHTFFNTKNEIYCCFIFLVGVDNDCG